MGYHGLERDRKIVQAGTHDRLSCVGKRRRGIHTQNQKRVIKSRIRCSYMLVTEDS